MAKAKPYRILTLKGGGIKAYAQLVILEEIEHLMGSPVQDIFDCIAGSSAGAANAAMLAAGLSPARIKSVYLERARDFARPRFRFWRSLFNAARFRGQLAKILPEHIHRFATAKPRLITLSRDIMNNVYYAFDSDEDKDLSMTEAIMRATAMLPAFEPYRGRWVDGGIGSLNNPTEAVLRHLLIRQPKLRTRVVFLESGLSPVGLAEEAFSGNFFSYASWSADSLLYDSDVRSHATVREFFPGVDYLPVSFTYSHRYGSFDMSKIGLIEDQAQRVAKRRGKDIVRFLKRP